MVRIPAILRRRYALWVALLLVTFALNYIWRLYYLPQLAVAVQVRFLIILGLSLPWAIPLAVLYAFWRWERRVWLKLRRADFAMCLTCGYDLSGCVESDYCPECGIETSAGEARKKWLAYRPIFYRYLMKKWPVE